MSTIELQKQIANNMLNLVETYFDPTCIVAGGAPRDWYFGNVANDIDLFLYWRCDLPNYYFEDKMKDLGIAVTIHSFGSVNNTYHKNPNIHRVFDAVVSGVPVQFILMHEKTFKSVVPTFPLSICRIWYKHGETHKTKEFEYTVSRNAIVQLDNTYADGVGYVKKIRNKFPEFSFWSDKETFIQATTF